MTERTVDDLLRLAVELAPQHSTAKALFAAVNERAGIDKTYAGWQGMINRQPEWRPEINNRLKRREQPTITSVTGVTANEWPNEDDIWDYLTRQWHKREDLERRRKSQKIVISDGPFCLVHFADMHLGGEGVDYPRLIRDIEIALSMPATMATIVGDLLDNYILGRMRAIRDNGAIDITAEWVIVKKILRMLAPILKMVISGNHDGWTKIAAGIDFLRDVIAEIGPDVIYDEHEIKVDLVVGGVSFPGKLRHSWKGNSQWNDLHAIEKDGKLTGDFVWGVGGHTHRSGLYSTFNVSGKTATAILCGPYKRFDDYGRQLGAIQNNEATAIAQVFDPDTKSMVMFDNLELAARFMEAMY